MKKRILKNIEWGILICTVLLIGIGMVALYSATQSSGFDELKKQAIYVDKKPIDEYLPDPDDAVFYEIVMEARKDVDAYLVTGNLKHFPEKAFVVTPKEMMDIISKEK